MELQKSGVVTPPKPTPEVPTKAIRPRTWDDYIGQDAMRERLRLHANAALSDNRRMDHVLLIGPPGAGKTTLAEVIAHSMRTAFKSYVWPLDFDVLQQVVGQFTGVVLFDEIHRGGMNKQEKLLPLIEDDYLQLPNGVRLSAGNRITFIGATTEPDKVIAPLYDRFPIKPAFDDYTDEEMALIVKRMAKILNADATPEMLIALGRATGGVPRNAESFVVTLRDMQTQGLHPTADSVLRMCRVTPEGLTVDHIEYLATLKAMGGTAGLRTLATHLRLPEPFVRELERLLVKQGKVQYGERGRVLQ